MLVEGLNVLKVDVEGREAVGPQVTDLTDVVLVARYGARCGGAGKEVLSKAFILLAHSSLHGPNPQDILF